MFDDREEMRRAGLVALAVGTTLGVAAAVVFGVRARLRRQPRIDITPELLDLETRVVDALAEDDVTGKLPLEIEAIAPGIIELSGVVSEASEIERSIAIAHGVDGVRTVVNRMDVGSAVEHLQATRRRFAEGAPELRESRWYGVGVGTGRRRQSPATDPSRPDDSIDMRTARYDAELQGEAFETPPQESGAHPPSAPREL
jgi:hypothetical protein